MNFLQFKHHTPIQGEIKIQWCLLKFFSKNFVQKGTILDEGQDNILSIFSNAKFQSDCCFGIINSSQWINTPAIVLYNDLKYKLD